MKIKKKSLKRKQKIVCFGGGSAMPKVILSELKKHPIELSGIVSMVDSGGSSGFLRKELKVLPPGDIRRVFLSLSKAPKWKKDLFDFRYGKEKLDGHQGHSVGNIFIAALESVNNDYGKALKQLHKFLEIKGKVLPATIEKTNLYAVLEYGKIISGETNIDIPKHNPNLKIKKLRLQPKAKAYPPAIQEIKKADLIAIGPGDLYSSLIPIFLIDGIVETIQKNKAKKVFICNAMTKIGETNDFSVLDFTKEIEKYIGCPLNSVIYNNKIPEKKRIERYKKEHPELLNLVRVDKNLDRKKFIGKNLLQKEGEIVYNSKKVVKEILNLI